MLKKLILCACLVMFVGAIGAGCHASATTKDGHGVAVGAG